MTRLWQVVAVVAVVLAIGSAGLSLATWRATRSAPDRIVARELHIVDGQGVIRASLQVHEHPEKNPGVSLELYDARGKMRSLTVVDERDYSGLTLMDGDGKLHFMLASTGDSSSTLQMMDKNGRNRASLSYNASTTGASVSFTDDSGQPAALLGVGNGKPYVIPR